MDTLKETLENFPKQFEWQPEIANADRSDKPRRQRDRSSDQSIGEEKIIVLGMGGSHLAADVLKTWAPYAERLIIHSDYGLPVLSESDLKSSLVVAVSHSGNTEEVLDGFNLAQKKGLLVAAVSCGGQLIETAQKNSRPYVPLPDAKVQPRLALGFHFRAILKLMGEEKMLNETKELAGTLKVGDFEKLGQELAEKIKDKIPVIYSSARKSAVAQIWKVKFNETAKIPAFFNTIPESNHNEMIGFTGSSLAKEIAERFFFMFLEDSYDQPQNQKRITATAEIYRDKGFDVETIKLSGLNHWHKIFSALVLADWISFYLAESYGIDPEKVPLVEEFKKQIAS